MKPGPNWGTAIAISPHYLLTAAHAVIWDSELRGTRHLDRAHIKSYTHSERGPNDSIRAGHDLHDDIDRENMLDYPSDDDYELQIYAFADGHSQTQLYVIGPEYESLDSMLDLVILYSPEPLQHEFYPKPSKAHFIACSTEIGLIAYHGDETESIYEDYPYTEPEDLDVAMDSLMADRLTLVKGRLGMRTSPEMIFHRCSSTAGASGGALVDINGHIFGMISQGVDLI